MPAREAAQGVARIGREPLFLEVPGRTFATPRTLGVPLPEPERRPSVQPGVPPEPSPGEARAAYEIAAGRSEALYDRIIAAAAEIARDADASLSALSDRAEMQLGAALARLDEDHAATLLDAAQKRDIVLERIASRTDILRAYIVEQSNRALGRMGALRREILALKESLKKPVREAAGTLRKAISKANMAGTDARVALILMGTAKRPAFLRSGKFSGEQVSSPAMREAMLEAAEHYGQPRIDADIEMLRARWRAVSMFAQPIAACGECEADGKLATLQGHADSLGVAGPRAIRSARDKALKSLDHTEDQLVLSVMEGHRQAQAGLAERHDQTRQMLIAQSAQASGGLRRDIERTGEQQIAMLGGVAAAQPAALGLVRGEIEKAARTNPTRAASLAIRSSERLQRNVASTAERHPRSVLGMAARAQDGRVGRAIAGGAEQVAMVSGFAGHQAKFIEETFAQVGQSVDQSLFDMAGVPGQVGGSCDSMLAAAAKAVASAKKEMPARIGFIAQKLTDACDGLVPISPESAPANPGEGHDPASAPMTSTSADASSSSVGSPNQSMTPATGVSAISSPATGGTQSSPDAESGRGGGASAPQPASCGPCDTARTAARATAAEGRPPSAEANASGPTGEGAGTATPAADAGDDVGVSSDRTNNRSPNAYAEFALPIARRPASAPQTDEFLGSVVTSVSRKIGEQKQAARTAILSAGETSYSDLMKNALRGLTPTQGRALNFSYFLSFGTFLSSDIIRHAYDGLGSGLTSTAGRNRDAALAALRGDTSGAAINELEAAFNFSNETDRIFDVMESMTQDQMASFVAAHGTRLEELLTQLSEPDQARFRLLMAGNTTRVRSMALRAEIDSVNNRYRRGIDSDRRGFGIGAAFAAAETPAERWALEGPRDRVDIYGLEDPTARDARERQRWIDVQRDVGNLDGVIDAIMRDNPNAAMSSADDPPGAILLAYATRPLTYELHHPIQRGGESREQALERQREEEARYGVTLGEVHQNQQGWNVRTATSTLSEYQQLYLQMAIRHGSTSREARAARTLAEFRRRDGVPPDYRAIETSLHSGRADAREGGNFEHGSEEAADRDRLATFAMMERMRRGIEGGGAGPVSGEDARAAFRREMEAAYRDRPQDLDVALGVIDSDAGNMQAVIDQAIAREEPALLNRYLGRMDSRQIERMVTEWNRRHPEGPGLMERLGLFQHHWSVGNMNGAVFTGDEANTLEIAMMGVPQTPQQRTEVALRIVNQQVEQAGWLGRLMCGEEYEDLTRHAAHLREVMGVREADIGADGRIRVTDDHGNVIAMNFDRNGQFRPSRGNSTSDLEMLVAGSRIVADRYANAVDRMATIMTSIIAVIGAVVLTVVTFGAGASVLLAMAVAAGFGALTIAVNASMRGGRYSRDDLTRDVVAAAIGVATAGLNVGIARGLAAGAKAATITGRALTMGERLLAGASRHALATTMLTQGAIGGMSNLASTALDPAMRRRDDYGDQVMHSFFRGMAGGMVTAGVAHGLNSGAAALAQRIAAGRAISAALAQGANRAQAIERAAEAAVRASSGRLMEVGMRGLINATSATAGRATEMGYENVAGLRHHGAGDFYAELRHAFIQNAIQGFAEGAALRVSRNLSWDHARTYAEQLDQQRDAAARAAGRAFDREAARLGIGPEAPGAEAANGPSSAERDTAASRAGEDAGPQFRAANDNEPASPRARAISDGEDFPATRRPANDDEAMRRLAPDEDDLRMRSADGEDSPPSQRKTGEFPALRPRTLDEHLASTDINPPPIFVSEDLTPARLNGGRSIPEHSEVRARNPRDAEASLTNYNTLRSADMHREVLLARCVDPANPRFGEFLVIQGGEGSVSRPPEGWIAERHSHPRLAAGDIAERLVRSLPSASGGDFAVLRREVDMMAGLVNSTRGVTRESVIDIRLGEHSFETHFSITRDGDQYSYRVTFRPPHDGVESIGPVFSLADYESAAQNLTGQSFSRNSRETWSSADGTMVVPARPRPVHGEALTAAARADVDFVAGRMALAGEFEGQMRGAIARGEGDPAIARAAAVTDAHERVVRMGLVGEPDSMIRLHNILNDDAIPAATRALISDVTLAETRSMLLRQGLLLPDEPLVMLFHGATPERTQSLVKDGISMARRPGGPNDDFGEGLYFTRSFETALTYRDRRSASDAVGRKGGVVPYLLRGREMGAAVDVSTGGPLRAQWETFALANARVLLQGRDGLMFTPMVEKIMRGQLRSFSEFDASLHQNRGTLFNRFLASIGAAPHVIFGDLGGPLTHGIQLADVTSQVVVRSQSVADILNAQHVRAGTSDADLLRTGSPLGSADDGPRMRTASAPVDPDEARAMARTGEHVDEVNAAQHALATRHKDGPRALIADIRARGPGAAAAQAKLDALYNTPRGAEVISISEASIRAYGRGLVPGGASRDVVIEGMAFRIYRPRATKENPRPALRYDASVPPAVAGARPRVYQFGEGELRVWRTQPTSEEPAGRIVQSSLIGPRKDRQGFEDGLFSQGESYERTSSMPIGPVRDGYHGEALERGHLHGAGLGVESRFGIGLVPREVNQALQNRGIEGWMRRIRDALPPGAELVYSTDVSWHKSTNRQSRIGYALDIIIQGRRVPFAEFAINVEADPPWTSRAERRGTRAVTVDPLEWRFDASFERVNAYLRALHEIVDMPEVLRSGLPRKVPTREEVGQALHAVTPETVRKAVAIASPWQLASHNPAPSSRFSVVDWERRLNAILNRDIPPRYIAIDMRDSALTLAQKQDIALAISRLPERDQRRILLLDRPGSPRAGLPRLYLNLLLAPNGDP